MARVISKNTSSIGEFMETLAEETSYIDRRRNGDRNEMAVRRAGPIYILRRVTFLSSIDHSCSSLTDIKLVPPTCPRNNTRMTRLEMYKSRAIVVPSGSGRRIGGKEKKEANETNCFISSPCSVI